MTTALLRGACLPFMAMLPAMAHAHDGHGSDGIHSHASDLGVILGIALVVACFAWGRRK